MDLDSFIIAIFCVIDESVPLATGGADSEVTIMEVVGEYLARSRTVIRSPTSCAKRPKCADA